MFGWIKSLTEVQSATALAALDRANQTEQERQRLLSRQYHNPLQDEMDRKELFQLRDTINAIRARFGLPKDRNIVQHFEDCDEHMRGLADRLLGARSEISDLRASNARMCDVLASVRERLGLDEGGSILDALDERKAKAGVEAMARITGYEEAQAGIAGHIAEEANAIAMAQWPGAKVTRSFLPAEDGEFNGNCYADMIGAPSHIVTADDPKPSKREGEPA